MKQFNICIDIDGTITDAYYYLELANRHFRKNITKEQVTEYSLDKVFGVKLEEFDEFYEKYRFEFHSNQELREGVTEVLGQLSSSCNLYFITARDVSMEALTKNYLEINKVPHDDLYLLGSHYKVEKAKELKCDIFIEDSYENAVQLAQNGFKVILLDTYYNMKPMLENIIRVNDWVDIHNIINEMLLQKAM
jgi:uncharacterized HAD superfamily protein